MKDMKTVKEIERELEIYQKSFDEALTDSNAKTLYQVHIKVIMRELEDARTIDSFTGNLRKASIKMKELYDLDEDVSDEEFNALKKKVNHYVDKKSLDIDLKIKELERQRTEVTQFEIVMKYHPADLWFSYLKDATNKED